MEVYVFVVGCYVISVLVSAFPRVVFSASQMDTLVKIENESQCCFKIGDVWLSLLFRQRDKNKVRI